MYKEILHDIFTISSEEIVRFPTIPHVSLCIGQETVRFLAAPMMVYILQHRSVFVLPQEFNPSTGGG